MNAFSLSNTRERFSRNTFRIFIRLPSFFKAIKCTGIRNFKKQTQLVAGFFFFFWRLDTLTKRNIQQKIQQKKGRDTTVWETLCFLRPLIFMRVQKKKKNCKENA